MMTHRQPGLIGLAMAFILFASCAPGVDRVVDDAMPRPGEESVTVHVVSNGWHTGIIVDRDHVPEGLIPEQADFPDARYLEFGWGDRVYYPEPNPTTGMALSAAMSPSPAVMHIAGHRNPPQTGPASRFEVLAIPMSARAHDELVRAIHDSFDRPGDEALDSSHPGLYPNSLFYPARGRFHLFNTCNTWTARKLATAGIDVPTGVIQADPLMVALRDYLQTVEVARLSAAAPR